MMACTDRTTPLPGPSPETVASSPHVQPRTSGRKRGSGAVKSSEEYRAWRNKRRKELDDASLLKNGNTPQFWEERIRNGYIAEGAAEKHFNL
jgi:hypothetical protein